MSDVTQILSSIGAGNAKAANELLPLVYEELRKLAAFKMANEASGQTLQPTALVHEAWLRLNGNQEINWQGRTHFFCAAAEAMRRILIDKARRKRAQRHGGGQQRQDILEVEIPNPIKDDELVALDEALNKFAVEDNQKAELVKLRYFVGLKIEEAAEILRISVPTANRWWAFARARLYQEIRGNSGSGNPLIPA